MIKSAILISVTALSLSARPCFSQVYPQFVGESVRVNQSAVEAELKKFVEKCNAKTGGKITRDGNLEGLLLDEIQQRESSIPDKEWKLVYATNKRALPELITAPIPWEEENSLFEYLSKDQSKIASMVVYDYILNGYLSAFPDAATKWLLRRGDSPKVQTIDLINFKASLKSSRGEGGEKRQGSYELWQKLYKSINPCCRLIALERFDSVPQTPENLLLLYRECLFNSATFLEIRVLEAIYRNHDYRPEVCTILEEYLKSGPLPDDQTRSIYMRPIFKDRLSAAKEIINAIKKESDGNVPPIKNTADSKSPTRETKGGSNPQNDAANLQGESLLDRLQLPLWGVVLTAALSLLWLVLKKRKDA